MRRACDACRLRKVKCRFDEGNRGCAFCTSIGIPCTTAPRQRNRTKAGRKAAAVPTASASTPVFSTAFDDAFAEAMRPAPRIASSREQSTSPYRRTTPPPAPSSCDNGPDHESDPTGAHGLSHFPRGRPSSSRARLLGVPGLSRAALDDCIETFFATIGQVLRLSEPYELFSRRVRVRLYYSAGLDVPAELADVAHNPATEMLVLAVACRGAVFGRHVSLAEPMYKRCCELASIPENLMHNGCDVVDSLLLLSELNVRTRRAKMGERTSPCIIDPIGKGGPIDLLFYHGLHIPPPQHAPDFNRRLLLHAIAWVHDALRSASANMMMRLTDDDMGWPVPVNGDDFAFVPLTLVTRQICRTLLSPRAKGLGLRDVDVTDAIAAIGTIASRTGISVDGVAALADPPQVGTVKMPLDGDRHINQTEYVFILSYHYWLYLVAWVAVQEDMDRHPGGLSLATVADAKAATTAAAEDMARFAELCSAHQLHVYAPRGVRNQFSAFAVFLMRDFAGIASPTVSQSFRYYALAEALSRGVRSARFFPDSAKLADTLLNMLHKGFRVNLRDAALVAERGLEALSGVSSVRDKESSSHKTSTTGSVAPHEHPRPPGSLSPTVQLHTPEHDLLKPGSGGSFSAPWTPPKPHMSCQQDPSSVTAVSADGETTGVPFQTVGTSHLPNYVMLPSGEPGQLAEQPAFVPPFNFPNPNPNAHHNSTQPDMPANVDLDWFSLMNTLMECGVELSGLIPDVH